MTTTSKPSLTGSDAPAQIGVSFREKLASLNLLLIIQSAALFALFAGLFAYVQYGTPALAGTDGYYHARMGLLLRQQGFKPYFDWLPLTILNPDGFYDHHFLYHIYLALFAKTDPILDGGLALTQEMKLASIFLPSLAFLAIWGLLRGQGIRWAAIWTMGLFVVSDAFLYRMSMPRAQAASLLFLILGLHWLLKERFWLLFPLGFAYVWLYDAFPLLILMAGVYFLVMAFTERRILWGAIGFPVLGAGLGLIINPYFPENIHFIVSHLLPKIGESNIRVGNEWYPYETWTLIENSGFALAALFLGLLALSWRKKRISPAALTVALLTLMFGLMLFRSRRFIEYFPAFTLILAAMAIGSQMPVRKIGRNWRLDLVPIVLLLVLSLPLWLTLSKAREAVSRSKPADLYADAAIWLRENTKEESLVFQTDWDDFPRLFFYNPENIYTIGLDPTYMQLYDADLYETWVEISQGKVDEPSKIIGKRFGADTIFSDLKHKKFLEKSNADPGLREIFRDDYAVIYSVLE